MSALIDDADGAFWFALMSSRPPNWRPRQSVRTESVSGPWKPTIITAPISWSSVNPSGPSWTVGEGVALDAGDALGEGVRRLAVEVELHAARTAARTSVSRRSLN